MLKVGIVGCGKIADAHLEQLQRVQGCEVVAACDREILMAGQLCERFNIKSAFADVGEMLEKSRPDVVHITTPPQSHFALGIQCLRAGSNIYVEKPFTLTTREAKELIRCAQEQRLKVTSGHDLQFSHAARRMRELIGEGYLGGEPVHMESYYCYDLTSPIYARALLSNSQHWVRTLPGKLLHNVISHGIARIAEFIGDQPRVIAHGFVSPMLRSLGEEEIIDELRVILTHDRRVTAYFTFSSQMSPSLNQFRIYGPKNGLVADEDHQTVIKMPGHRRTSYAEKFVSPIVMAGHQVSNVRANVVKFFRNDFHMKAGLKHLIEAFYESIRSNAPLPISYREIITTAYIMDLIFEQIHINPSIDIEPNVGQTEAAVLLK